MDWEKLMANFGEKLDIMLRLFSFLLFSPSIFAQSGQHDPAYKSLVANAFEHLQKGECTECLNDYEQAFGISQHSALSHLRAATCAEKCGQTEKRDQLIRTAASIGWDVCLKLLKDAESYPEFERLLGTPFEKTVRLLAQQQAEALGINFDLKIKLDRIHYLDQKYRQMMDSMLYEHPKDSPLYKAFVVEWLRCDSANLAQIEEIIEAYGFPGKSLVGKDGARTVWLVIQHAPLEKQEQYFPLLTDAAEKGEMDKGDWAYLFDRINMRNKRPQVYGSQVISDPVTGAPLQPADIGYAAGG